MYAALFRRFSELACAKIHRGQALTPAELRAFRILLDARELQGRPLGTFARHDPPFDTVTGRCGHPPFVHLGSEQPVSSTERN